MTPTTVLVTPTAPAATGNGLAMRAGMLLESLADAGPVDVVIAPVSGPADLSTWARQLARRVVVVPLPTGHDDARRHTTAQLGEETLRDRLARTDPLPGRARLVPPTLTGDVAPLLDGCTGCTVVVLREYLVPFGTWLARALGADRLAVDLDDDAEAMLRHLGHHSEGDGYGRLARTWLPDADVVTAASRPEAEAMTRRYDIDVDVVANAVRVPIGGSERAPTAGALVYVGNLTYEPNVDAAYRLVDEVLPLVRASCPTASVTLVGRPDDRVVGLGERAGVTVAGAVDDVAPYYAAAAAAVVPLRHGAGTRIKVLEAMAHRCPVVATPAAVAGLGLVAGRDHALADTPALLAAATVALLDDERRRSEMVDAAFATVTRDHTVEAVAPAVRRTLLGRPGHRPTRSRPRE